MKFKRIRTEIIALMEFIQCISAFFEFPYSIPQISFLNSFHNFLLRKLYSMSESFDMTLRNKNPVHLYLRKSHLQ